MHNTILYKNKKIAYSISGEGKVIVLLHGYIESLDAWNDFSEELQKKFRVLSIDLPGHGNSEVIDEIHSMELMSDVVNAVLIELKIEKCVLVGHSMGGYVAMEFVEKYGNKLDGFCLFHSTPFSDSEEKKKLRDRLIESIEKGKKIILAKEHVNKTFATENLDKFVEEVGFMKIIAVNTSAEGTIAALKGMKNRKNHQQTFENTKLPVLWILGKKDNFISPKIVQKISISKQIKIEILSKSGHQGYIEEKQNSINILQEFMSKI